MSNDRKGRSVSGYDLRSGAGTGAGGGETGVGTPVDGPLPGAIVIFTLVGQ